jgi:hypothetical protein
VILELEAIGVDAAGRRFDLIGERIIDARPLWTVVLDDLLALNRRRFDSRGRVGGRPWARLSPRTLARKARDHDDPRPLHRRRALRRSLTERRAPGQRLRLDPTSMLLGTDLPYAPFVARRRPPLPTSRSGLLRDMVAERAVRFFAQGRT